MATIIQLRRDTASDWTSANPVLSNGELGIETDTGAIKIGNGVDAWVDLDYFGGSIEWGDISGTLLNQTDLQNALNLKADATALPTNTSDLNNDGADGVNPFITASDIPSAPTPNLQQVTDEGATTTNEISSFNLTVNGSAGAVYRIVPTGTDLRILSVGTDIFQINRTNFSHFNSFGRRSQFLCTSITADRDYTLPDKDITFAGLEDLIEENIFSDLTEDNTVSGTYTFDFDNSRRKVLEMTADTDFSVESLAIGQAAAFNVTLTGDFAPTWLSTTVTPTSDTYDGTIDNRLTFDCYRKADGTQVNILTIENLS